MITTFFRCGHRSGYCSETAHYSLFCGWCPTRSTFSAKLAIILYSLALLCYFLPKCNCQWANPMSFVRSSWQRKNKHLFFSFFFERKNESRSWDFGTLEQARAHGCNYDRVGNPVSSVWHVKNWVPFTLCFIISYVMSEVMPLPSSVFLF